MNASQPQSLASTNEARPAAPEVATSAALAADLKTIHPSPASSAELMEGYVKVQAAPAALPNTEESSSSTSSLSSDTDDMTRDSDSDLESSIAYLKEKQYQLQRFSVELQQDELYKATMVREDIARKEEEEQESMSASSFTLSDDEDDEDFTNSGVSIWVRAKKILKSLSRHRGVLYHPASKTSKRAAANVNNITSGKPSKKQRRVRFGPDVTAKEDSHSFPEDDLERASKCARRIMDRSNTPAVRLMTASDFAVSEASQGRTATLLSPPPSPADTSVTTDCTPDKPSSDAYMSSLQVVLAETKSLPSRFQTNSIPFQTAG